MCDRRAGGCNTGMLECVRRHWHDLAGPEEAAPAARSCSQDEPEALRAQLEALLASNGVQYEYSKTSKFANFVNRTLL